MTTKTNFSGLVQAEPRSFLSKTSQFFPWIVGAGMKPKYLAPIIGILFVGCSAPAGALLEVPPIATITLIPSTETPTDEPIISSIPLAGVEGIEPSGGFLWAWSEYEIWRYTEGEWSYYAAAPASQFPFVVDVAFVSDTLWVVADNKLQYFDGDEWQEIPGQYLDLFRVEADNQTGILWVSAGETLYRWNGKEMTDFRRPPVSRGFFGEIAMTEDGYLWVSSGGEESPELGELIRYDDATDTWEIMPPWRADEESRAHQLGPTPNGDLWIMLIVGFQFGDESPCVRPWVLAHRDGASGEWTAFECDLPEGQPWLMVADDEAVWLANGWGWLMQGGFDGLARFDGETWSHYLQGDLVLDVGIAPDGSIWYTTGDDRTLHQLK